MDFFNGLTQDLSPRSSTFTIDQDMCNACGACLPLIGEFVKIGNDSKPQFKDAGNFGTTESAFILEAIDVCPVSAIKEIG